MIPDKLKQTDQTLIELLSERLSLLEESVPIEAQIASMIPQLAGAGVPESVWASLVMSCHAALNSAEVTYGTSVPPKKITIIGGSGKMGKFFQAHLEAAGHHVSSLDRGDWEHEDRLEQLLGHADIVLVSVPIERTVDIIKRAAKYLSSSCALADITSLKTEPLYAMLEHHDGPVMGLHPMFGPSVKSFSGQKVVVCPGRNDNIFQWLLDLMKSQGAQLITSTPEEHDRLMVIIQATRHFARFSLGVFLTEEEIDIDRSLLMASPPYRQEIDIVKRLFAQSSHLCVDIMLATEERCQTIARLADTYNRLAKLVLQKDRAALIQEFESTQSLFNEIISSHKSDSVTQMSYENHADRHISRHRMSVVPNR